MSSEYWRNRALENDKRRREHEERNIARIQKSFEDCMSILSSGIEAFYAKYGTNGAVSAAAAHKPLTREELKAFRTKIASLERTATEAEKAVLSRLRARVRVSRQEALLAEIRQRLVQLTDTTIDTMHDALEEAYREQESHDLYNLEQELRIGVDFNRFADSQLDALIQTGYDGTDFSSKVWYDTSKLLNSLNMLLPRAFLIGASVNSLTTELRKAMNTPRYAAERLIRTEGAFLAGQADMRLYSEAGIDKYEFLATLDDRTSEICLAMDGKVFKRSQAEVGVNLPPLHPNCRSTTLPVFDDDTLEGMRLAKDVNGQYIRIPKQSYADWARRPLGEYVQDRYYASVHKYYQGPSERTFEENAAQVCLPNGRIEELTPRIARYYDYDSIAEYLKTYMDAVERLLPDAQIGVRVHAKTVQKILQDGIYRPNNAQRKVVEQVLLGIKSDAPAEAYPAYGALYTPKELEDVVFEKTSRYGECIIVLQRSRVENRTTFTLGDSVNTSKCVTPSPLDRPNIGSIAGIRNADEIKNATTLTALSANRFSSDRYAEVQIEGGFSLSDISYIRLMESPNAELAKLLKANGVQWVLYQEPEA